MEDMVIEVIEQSRSGKIGPTAVRKLAEIRGDMDNGAVGEVNGGRPALNCSPGVPVAGPRVILCKTNRELPSATYDGTSSGSDRPVITRAVGGNLR